MKLHHWFFLFFILLLPTQLTLYFWPDYSLVRGIRVDYLAPVVYFTDLIFIVFSALWLYGRRIKFSKNNIFKIVLLLIFIFVNINVSTLPLVSLFKWLKIVEAIVLFFYVRNIDEFLLKRVSLALLISIIFTAVLAFAQLLNGSSLNGFFYFFGERRFNTNSTSIALFSFSGREHLRPYATFPHPNAMAGYALLLMGIVFRLSRNTRSRILAGLSGGGVVLMSMSQNAWAAFLVAILIVPFVNKNALKFKLFALSAIVLSIIFAIVSFNLLAFQWPREIMQRLELTTLSGIAIGERGFFGFGLGTFPSLVPWLNSKIQLSGGTIWWLQPVHNIPLLIFTETGIAGVILITFLINKFSVIVIKNKINIFMISAIIMTSLLDHYWLTINQNLMLMAVAFGIICHVTRAKINTRQ